MFARLLSLSLTSALTTSLIIDFSWARAVISYWLITVLAGGVASRQAAAEPQQRVYRAYLDAWKQRTDDADASLTILRESFKHHSAPGAYVEPDGAALSPWIEAWRSSLTPEEARRYVRRAS